MAYSTRSKVKRSLPFDESDQSRKPPAKKPAKDWKTSSEKAVNVDGIVESLFRYFNCSMLTACRLVCHTWQYFGAKELQSRGNVTIQLSFGYVLDKSEKSVRSLLAVMESARAQGNTFPCGSFSILTEELSSPRVHQFFRAAERQNQIKKLSLTLNYEKKKLAITESDFLRDLWSLVGQTSSILKTLEIKLCFPQHWAAHELNIWDLGSSPAFVLPNLRSLNLSGSVIPKRLFYDVMDASVNLQSYECSGLDGFSIESLKYFVDLAHGNGRQRIHLLKHLEFRLSSPMVEVMEEIISQHGEDLKLETFEFLHFWATQANGAAIIWPRASTVISQLLEYSSSTLIKLKIGPMRFLPGLSIPRLPCLSTLFLSGELFFTFGRFDNNYFFPPDVSIVNNFPTLNTIVFGSASSLSIWKSLLMLDISERITSVKVIYACGQYVNDDDDFRQLVHTVFPSAELVYI